MSSPSTPSPSGDAPPQAGSSGPGQLARRQFLARGGGAALALTSLGALLAACGGDDGAGSATAGGTTGTPQIGGDLTALAWLPYVDPRVSKPFTSEHGVTIKNTPLATNDEILTKLKAGGIGKIDLVSPNVTYVPQFAAAGVLQPIDVARVPNLRKLLPAIDRTSREAAEIDGELYAVPYLWGYDAMVYNATKVPEPPTKWMDLMEPEFTGKVILADGPNANFEIWPRVLGYDPTTLTKDQLDETVDFLIEFKKKQVRAITPDQNDQIELLRSGDAWVIGSGAFAGLPEFAEGKGDKLSSTIPAPGGATWIDAWAVPKDAPNLDTALAYIDFMIGVRQQTQLAPALLEAAVNADAVPLLPKANRALFPYDSEAIGTGDLPLFKLPSGDPAYASSADWSEAWQRVAAA